MNYVTNPLYLPLFYIIGPLILARQNIRPYRIHLNTSLYVIDLFLDF